MLGINTIQITPELMTRACEVDEFKGLWNGLDQHTVGLNILSDVAEHSARFNRVLDPLKKEKVTVLLLQMIHQKFVSDKKDNPSTFKTEPNQLNILGADGVPAGFLETAPPEDVEALMNKLVSWFEQAYERRDMHPLITIAVFMAVFLQISPFAEGNMRVMQFLVLLMLLRAGYKYAPFQPIEKAMQEKADAVYLALKHNQDSLEAGRPDWSEWLRCFFMLMQDQKEVLEKRLNQKEGEMQRLPTLSARILRLFEHHERLTMKQIIFETYGRRSTVKVRLREMEEQGLIKRNGAGRGTWYSL